VTFGVAFLVVLGVIAMILLGIGTGFDTGALIIIGFIALFGGLAIAVARKARTGAVAPATCASCGGLISPNAPYCKHCGTPVSRITNP
jgi:hypothetical protein